MRILIADDNNFYRQALEMTLRTWGYEVTSVANGEAAWEVLKADDAPKLAILDWMMPGLDGPEVCRRLRALYRHEPTYVILLTSRQGKDSTVAGLESGADDYVIKPFDRKELEARLKVGRRIVGLQTSATVVHAFAQAVDGKSPYTRGHSERVTQYALALASRLGLSASDRDLVRRGGSIHDIGKISVPDSILNKPGPLTPEERRIICQHPLQGAQMLESMASVHDLLPIVRWHHERLDGKGYPDGIAGDQIPLLVRIVSVADVYDAVRSDRPYRGGLPHDECLTILRKDAAGGSLDPKLVDEFCKIEPDPSPLIALGR